jgi:heme-degrading monooxygenase HmoA
MILEVAVLYIKRGEETQFEKDFSLAGKIISSANGYVSTA